MVHEGLSLGSLMVKGGQGQGWVAKGSPIGNKFEQGQVVVTSGILPIREHCD